MRHFIVHYMAIVNGQTISTWISINADHFPSANAVQNLIQQQPPVAGGQGWCTGICEVHENDMANWQAQ